MAHFLMKIDNNCCNQDGNLKKLLQMMTHDGRLALMMDYAEQLTGLAPIFRSSTSNQLARRLILVGSTLPT